MDPKTTDWRAGPNVCRCCLAEGCYKDISTEYFWMGKREVYAEMLSETLNLSIAYSNSGGPNSNSRLICELCISRLRDASDFKRQVQECERTFLRHLDPGSSSMVGEVEVTVEPTEIDPDVKLEHVKQEKAVSDDDDDFDERCGFDEDDDDDLDDQPLTRLASRIPKKESVDLLDLLDNTKATEKRKSSSKTKTVPAKKAKTIKKDVKATSSKAPVKTEKKKKGRIDLKVKWRPKRKYNDYRDNAAIILECSNACPFRWKRGAFTCAFCPLSFGEFSEVKTHSVEHPNKVEALRLARTFANVKAEVTNLQCELCPTRMTDLNALSEHLISVHNKPIISKHGLGVTPFYLSGKEFNCTHCDETFELFSKLNTHLNKHYPNSICFQCGKAFSSVNRLKSHLIIHDPEATTQYKCTKCDQVFPTRVLRNSHITLTHGPENRYRCPYCKESFKSYADRGKHLKKAHDKTIEYPCNLCSSVFAMCNQRTKHIKQVHMKIKEFACDFCSYKFVTAAQLRNHMIKHVGERKYQCQVCKKAYARTKTLREHMRIHNNDKRFVCQYCSNAYVQKCSLQSHMRTHHPNAEPVKKVKLPNLY
ncbi:zinc finger protein 486-like isoform X10 [Spodoptera litura]|uniref:Zinc finger protein 486-like isoform X10 n=1 Tax=Spodoptera litura TaxID=69820 RepID=A0A9J7DUS6_SPOLT|nr:zinc finger protein 486-like isoform X10 [Spodoptera litura]